MSSDPSPDLPRLGWREWVSFPDLPLPPLRVKVDTGARTSALHVVEVTADGDSVRTLVDAAAVPVTLPLVEHRHVTSSSGARELRPVVVVDVDLGARGEPFPIEVTLTSRADLRFPMLLGRQALRHRFLVDPAGSFLAGAP